MTASHSHSNDSSDKNACGCSCGCKCCKCKCVLKFFVLFGAFNYLTLTMGFDLLGIFGSDIVYTTLCYVIGISAILLIITKLPAMKGKCLCSMMKKGDKEKK